MATDSRPVLGISAGDPGGIGPEIAVKALNRADIYDICRPLVVADARFMEDVIRFTNVPLSLNRITRPQDGLFIHGTMDILHMANMDPDRLNYKQVVPEQGQASFEYVVKIIELALNKEIDGTVTGPINKAAINAAGHHFAGHTEIFPAIEHAKESGKNVEGPIPADTVFPKMKGGMYDAVVVMYHDQGHIPMKLLGFEYDEQTGQWDAMSGVNVTLGLPIVRTSVDHGTAFGKAGEGRANPQSMIEAIRLAALLSKK